MNCCVFFPNCVHFITKLLSCHWLIGLIARNVKTNTLTLTLTHTHARNDPLLLVYEQFYI